MYSLLSMLQFTLRGSLHVFSLYQSLISMPKFLWETVLWQSASQSASHLTSLLSIQYWITSVKQRYTSVVWFCLNIFNLFSGTSSIRPRKCHLSRENPLSVPDLSRFRTFMTLIINSGSNNVIVKNQLLHIIIAQYVVTKSLGYESLRYSDIICDHELVFQEPYMALP